MREQHVAYKLHYELEPFKWAQSSSADVFGRRRCTLRARRVESAGGSPIDNGDPFRRSCSAGFKPEMDDGLSPAATTHGEGGVWAALAYVGGVGGMVASRGLREAPWHF
jgi:hypothetical protein